jgi:phosphoglycerate dehydrogenase-like enzyme
MTTPAMTASGSARPRVLVTRRLPEAVEARLRGQYEVTTIADDRPLTLGQLSDALDAYDALVPTITDRIDAGVIGPSERRVRILANFGAGTDHIDLAAARHAGIMVSNTPGALTEATADIAMTLILMAMRRAGEGERLVRAGAWDGWRPTQLLGRSLGGKTLGLVGFGRIARATAQRAQAFGMSIAYHSRTRAGAEQEAALGARYLGSLAALAAEADVLSVHVPGGAATYHLIDAAVLAALGPAGVLVNTARGPVVDEVALAAALEAGTLGGAGLDVYEQEPHVPERLRACPGAVLLPHLGSATIEARTAMGMQAVDNLDACLAGLEPPDRVA